MEIFDIQHLIAQQAAEKRPYLEFLRQETMSLGLYVLPAGGLDPQQPHNEDEVYYVLKGQGKITVGEEVQAVQTGSLIYVAAHMPHKFHDISEPLQLLVFFAPPESN